MTRAHIQLGINPEFDRIVFVRSEGGKRPHWCITNVATLLKYWQVMTDEELAKMFRCGVRRVVEKREELGLLRKRPIRTNELRHVEANYLLSNYADIAQDLDRSEASVGYMVKAYINKR